MSKTQSTYAIDKIRKEHALIDYIKLAGHTPIREYGNRWTFVCPIHKDNDPSFMVYKNDNDVRDYQTYFCWGCLDENEKIWTNKGFIPIRNVKIGHRVIDIYGKYQRVDGVRYLQKPLIEISTGFCGQALKLTKDHTCFYVKEKDMCDYVPYISKRSKGDIVNKSFRFSSRAKDRKVSKKYRNKIQFQEGDAKNIEVGDFLACPVIPEEHRKAPKLNFGYMNKKGPIVRVYDIVPNENIAWLIGLWLAEGSLYRGGIAFSLNINETEYVNKIKYICEKEFDLNVYINQRKDKNLCEVKCSSTYLEHFFRNYFGDSCDSKRIPVEFLSWPKGLQESLLNGYIDGDGNFSRSSSISVSEDLSFGVFSLSIQSEKLPYISNKREGYVDKNDVYHKPSWIITYRERESLNGFYDYSNGTKYYFTNVCSVNELSGLHNVVDISVDNTNSFVTSSFVVHNCKASGDIISLKAELEYGGQHGRGKALTDLGHGLDLSFDGEIDYIVNELKKQLDGDAAQFDGNVFDDISLKISTLGYEAFAESEYDSYYLSFMDGVYKELDKYALNKDVGSMNEAYEYLIDDNKLKEFQDDFVLKRERRLIEDE